MFTKPNRLLCFSRNSWVRSAVPQNDDVESKAKADARLVDTHRDPVKGQDYVLDCLGNQVFVGTLLSSDKDVTRQPVSYVLSIDGPDSATITDLLRDLDTK